MIEKKIIEDKHTGDKTYYYKHESGLDLYISEMRGFSTSVAYFGTRYGSINNSFKEIHEKEFTNVPAGIAHYLEHKLFENEDCDAFVRYAKTGADANAYTTYDRTCYYFKCSNNFYDSYKILLDFVQKPYFTDKTVEKEQGIIAQEIKMTEDEPEWAVFNNLLRALFHNHPVRLDIAGTVDSIKEINKDLLYKCYNSFYNLNNMVIAVAGNVDHEKVAELTDKLLLNKEPIELVNNFPKEPRDIVTNYVDKEMKVGLPIFNIGFKCPPVSGNERIKDEEIADILFRMLTDQSSKLFKKLINKNLINSDFEFEIFSGNGYFVPILSCESKSPKDTYKIVIEEFDYLKSNGIDKKLFEEIKRSSIGSLFRESNNVDAVASNLVVFGLDKVDPYYGNSVIFDITPDDVNKFIKEKINTKDSALSVIHNGGKQDED